MVEILRIFRSIEWIPKALQANRDENPIPEGYWSAVMPTVEIFGTQLASEINVITSLGTVAGIELAHTAVPDNRVRQYMTMEYSHDDPVDRRLVGGRTYLTALGFPFVGMRDGVEVASGETLAIRNFIVGPSGRAAVQASGMGAGARLTVTFVWVEFPLGEHTKLT